MIKKYKVTVHNDMIDSNKFYLKTGFTFFKTFNMYDMQWNLYVKDIE